MSGCGVVSTSKHDRKYRRLSDAVLLRLSCARSGVYNSILVVSEVGKSQFEAIGESDSLLDQDFELADIARPVGLGEEAHGGIRDVLNVLVRTPAEFSNEIVGQERNVITP